MTKSLKAYRIPKYKKREYFDFVEKFKKNFKNVGEENWNTYNDHVAVIDTSHFLFSQVMAVRLFMSKIGAEDITESFLSS